MNGPCRKHASLSFAIFFIVFKLILTGRLPHTFLNIFLHVFLHIFLQIILQFFLHVFLHIFFHAYLGIPPPRALVSGLMLHTTGRGLLEKDQILEALEVLDLAEVSRTQSMEM